MLADSVKNHGLQLANIAWESITTQQGDQLFWIMGNGFIQLAAGGFYEMIDQQRQVFQPFPQRWNDDVMGLEPKE